MIYSSISDGNEIIAVIRFESVDDINPEFVDNLHDNGYIMMKISKDEYDAFDQGDELNMYDLFNGDIRFE